jgi:ATP-dependent DNA helicase DinG
METRLEELQRRGVNPFLAFSLPEAILKFRQGAGRLIRTVTDKGIVSILDSRVLTKPYGRLFLAALPKCPVEVIGREGDVEPLDAFFV